MFCRITWTFPVNNLIFHWRWSWWDQIQAIFLNLFYFSQKSGKKATDRRISQEFASKLDNSARIASRSFGAADFNYWCCDNINLNVGAICYPDWNSWRIMLPSALKLFINTPQVIEKRQNLPIRKSKWKQNSNLENQVALPKVSCQNCPKMIHKNINKTNRLSLLMPKTM